MELSDWLAGDFYKIIRNFDPSSHIAGAFFLHTHDANSYTSHFLFFVWDLIPF